MGSLTVRELNQNISGVLSRVANGEAIDILRNGKVIAEIRPKTQIRDDAWRAAYRESVTLLRKGIRAEIGAISEDDKYGDAVL